MQATIQVVLKLIENFKRAFVFDYNPVLNLALQQFDVLGIVQITGGAQLLRGRGALLFLLAAPVFGFSNSRWYVGTMKAKRERNQENIVTAINVTVPSIPPRKPQKWRDCCGLSKEQWEYSAKWSDYLDWSIALEAARQRNQTNDEKSEGSSTQS